MTTHVMRVAAVQAAPVWFEAEPTTTKAISLIEEAGAQKVDLIVFPETWLPGYPHFIWSESNSEWPAKFFAQYFANSVRADGPEIERIRMAAKNNAVAVVLGISEISGGSLYISQAIIDSDGQLRKVRRKFRPTHAERTLFGEGDGSDFETFRMNGAAVGALSCWEHMQPLIKYTMNALGEQVHAASWPAVTQPYINTFGFEAYERINSMYAMENQCFVVQSTSVFDDRAAEIMAFDEERKALLHRGGGFGKIYAPDGRSIGTSLAPEEEGLVLADIDLTEIALAKNTLDQTGHYSRPNIFKLSLDDRKFDAINFVSGRRLSEVLSREVDSTEVEQKTTAPTRPDTPQGSSSAPLERAGLHPETAS